MPAIRVSRTGEMIVSPPELPSYLRAIHELKPIVGKPTDEDVKGIHAVIRALGAVSHLPTFYNPDLSMQLSQYLFGVQMAVFKVSYSMTLMPGDKSVFIPPELPLHIPGALNQVVGAPSDEEIKSAQSALRNVENLSISPQLFDADLSMRLSQHFFNLQFARYMRESSAGQFVSESEPEGACLTESRPIQETRENLTTSCHGEASGLQRGGNIASVSEAGEVSQARSGLPQLGEAMKGIQDVLENMDRILTLIKRDQSTIGCVDKYYHIYKNPLNQQGRAASECGLPRLRYGFYDKTWKFGLWMTSDQIAGYLKFFNIGSDLIQLEDEGEPRLLDGKGAEAEQLLLNYIDAQ
ncbi:laminin domain protein, putative [Rhizoctonia solani AG-3 Rhs1AP]|uniref:Laminin domain protein, putative n=1 Tax=Rhizoctonia solani AG-3 Rhs1AP TaxID=1086054 RepID=X8IYK5_9AGAM|nr:laminin domain protein, putative [Rhizoctonia solani AG-3 Rhs1AP]